MAVGMVTAGVLCRQQKFLDLIQLPSWLLKICQHTVADSMRQKYPSYNCPFIKWILLQLKASSLHYFRIFQNMFFLGYC